MSLPGFLFVGSVCRIFRVDRVGLQIVIVANQAQGPAVGVDSGDVEEVAKADGTSSFYCGVCDKPSGRK